MKNILIIGDSWAVPNYYGPPGDPAESHIEFILRELGYNIFNCGMNGSSNERSIILADTYLSYKSIDDSYKNSLHPHALETLLNSKRPEQIDFVIWFHTETLRSNFKKNIPMDTLLTNGYKKTYAFAKKFFDKFNLNNSLIVLGGQSPIYKKLFYNYFNPLFIIEDWRSELLKTNIEIHWLTNPNWIEYGGNSISEKEKLIEITSTAYKLMRESTFFPDGCHPGALAHQILLEKLIAVFEKNNTNPQASFQKRNKLF